MLDHLDGEHDVERFTEIGRVELVEVDLCELDAGRRHGGRFEIAGDDCVPRLGKARSERAASGAEVEHARRRRPPPPNFLEDGVVQTGMGAHLEFPFHPHGAGS